MKRIGGLFEGMADAGTLVRAAWKAARGKRQRPEVRRFLARLDEETGRLVHSLRDGSFRFGEYRTFSIRDPKTREIHAPPFRDRVVHHALMEVSGPILERGAIAASFACRAGRGQHAALRQAKRWMRPRDWFLKIDLTKFYDNVNQELLRALLARRFRERRLLDLFDLLLLSYHRTPGNGLPIGALTSQYLGNFYLDSFDHWVTQSRRIHCYLRYMDDLLFLGDRETLNDVRKEIPSALEGLGLRINGEGILNRCEEGVPYLGFVVYPNRIRLNRQGRRRLRRRFKMIERSYESGNIEDRELQSRATALFAHARFGDDVAWRRMAAGFSRMRETQEPGPRHAGRLVEQHGEELPLGVSQQEQAG